MPRLFICFSSNSVHLQLEKYVLEAQDWKNRHDAMIQDQQALTSNLDLLRDKLQDTEDRVSQLLQVCLGCFVDFFLPDRFEFARRSGFGLKWRVHEPMF